MMAHWLSYLQIDQCQQRGRVLACSLALRDLDVLAVDWVLAQAGNLPVAQLGQHDGPLPLSF